MALLSEFSEEMKATVEKVEGRVSNGEENEEKKEIEAEEKQKLDLYNYLIVSGDSYHVFPTFSCFFSDDLFLSGTSRLPGKAQRRFFGCPNDAGKCGPEVQTSQ